MKNKILIVLFLLLMCNYAYSYQININGRFLSEITIGNDNYDMHAVNILLQDDNGNNIQKNIKFELGTYICGSGIAFYKTIDDKLRYECIDYLNVIDSSIGAYYTYLLVPSGYTIDDYNNIYYLQGVFEDNIKGYYTLMIIFFAVLTILLAL